MDKATETARKNLLKERRRVKIIKRVEEKEYIKRCLAVDICPECGKDHVNIEHPGSHWVSLACSNRRCSEYNKIKKSRDC